MRIAFIDFSGRDYTPLTPSERPLGGIESALCYLARALAARAHSVTLINGATPGSHGGVDCVNLSGVDGSLLNNFDVIISIFAGSAKLRQAGVTRPIIFWIGHDIDQPAVQPLHDGTERYLWDRIVMVSNWQAKRYSESFRIKSEQISVLRYAIAPAFERTHRNAPYFFASGRPPVLAYTSTPFRGLDVLVRAFPLIRARIPGSEAKIYSSMAVYHTPAERDPHRGLYDLCRATEGVDYIGSLGQTALAEAMSQVDIFAYPNTFPETSCISLTEAMASGCLVATTTLGALPETAAGFGNLCDLSVEPQRLAEVYAEFTAQTIRDAYDNPGQWTARLEEQRAFVLKNYSWSERAKEWEDMLESISREPARSLVPRRNDPCPCRSGEKFKHCCGIQA